MIFEAKNLLENVIKHSCEGEIKKIAKTVDEEKTAISQLFIPLAAIITDSNSRFDENGMGDFPLILNANRTCVPIRGKRIIPIVIRITAKNEHEADTLLSKIISNIPSKWQLPIEYPLVDDKNLTHTNKDMLDGDICIIREEHSDSIQKMGGTYISAILLEMSMGVIAHIKKIPVIRESTLDII
ncbi:MAG: hypothetical protein ACRC5H_07625 [Treponemataceae bacterium]